MYVSLHSISWCTPQPLQSEFIKLNRQRGSQKEIDLSMCLVYYCVISVCRRVWLAATTVGHGHVTSKSSIVGWLQLPKSVAHANDIFTRWVTIGWYCNYQNYAFKVGRQFLLKSGSVHRLNTHKQLVNARRLNWKGNYLWSTIHFMIHIVLCLLNPIHQVFLYICHLKCSYHSRS